MCPKTLSHIVWTSIRKKSFHTVQALAPKSSHIDITEKATVCYIQAGPSPCFPTPLHNTAGDTSNHAHKCHRSPAYFLARLGDNDLPCGLPLPDDAEAAALSLLLGLVALTGDLDLELDRCPRGDCSAASFLALLGLSRE